MSLSTKKRPKKCVLCPNTPRQKQKKSKSRAFYYGFCSRHRYWHHRTKLAFRFWEHLAPLEIGARQASPSSPSIPQQGNAGAHLQLRSHLEAPDAPKKHAERLQNKFSRRVAKRARVIFEIRPLKRIILAHFNLCEGKPSHQNPIAASTYTLKTF